MHKMLRFGLLCSGIMLLLTGALAAQEKTEIATTPVSGEKETGWRSFWWPRYQEKEKQAASAPAQIRLVLLGDSITHYWETHGKTVYAEKLLPYHPLNLGMSGDRTQQMLWIIEKSGIFNRIHPQLVIMMIGTNNLGWRESTPEETAAAIERAVQSLRRLNPETAILLFGVFPRGAKADDPSRIGIAQINEKIKLLADEEHVFYEDIGPLLMNPDGSISAKIMADYLHPTNRGYEIWAAAIQPYLDRFLH